MNKIILKTLLYERVQKQQISETINSLSKMSRRKWNTNNMYGRVCTASAPQC